MASGEMTTQPAAELLGWEWAPPPAPQPSALRLQETPWQEPVIQPHVAKMSRKTRGILCVVGGGLALVWAVFDIALLFVAVPLLVVGAVDLRRVVNGPPLPVKARPKTRDDYWREYQERHRLWS